MPVESATYINDLNTANPAATDALSQGDDHLRLLKAVLKTSFTGITGAVTATHTQLNQLALRTLGLADGAATTPSLYFDSETTLGFYRASSRHLSLSQDKRLNGNGALPTGALVHFAKVPSNMTSGGAATATPNRVEWIECDGSVYNISDFPDLGAFLGSTYGGNGTTTFGVPNTYDTGRFLRSRTASVTLGTSQSNQNAAHTHAAGTLAADSGGAHTHTGTTASSGAHSHTVYGQTSTAIGGAGGWFTQSTTGDQNKTTSTDGAHTHTFTTDSGGAHTHTISGSTASSGGTEARPEALVTVLCVKT